MSNDKNKESKIGIEEDGTRESDRLLENKHSASPMVWIPTSIFIALCYAAGNIIVSYLSHFDWRVRTLEAPTTLVTNCFILGVISYQTKYPFNEEGRSDEDENKPKRYLDWFWDIIYVNELDDKYVHGTSRKIHWVRIFLAFFLAAVFSLRYYLFIVSYRYAVEASLNSGVLMSIYGLKPILGSISFYIFFGQTLRAFEIAGIGILAISIVIITFSNGNLFDSDASEDTTLILLSVLLQVIVLFIHTFQTTVMKYFLAYRGNQVNVSAFANLVLWIVDVAWLIVFIIDIVVSDFRFTAFEFFIAQVTGVLWSLTYSLIIFVNLRGKAGTSDALIETSAIYQAVIDGTLFGRIPNLLQIIGATLGALTSLIIVIGYKVTS